MDVNKRPDLGSTTGSGSVTFRRMKKKEARILKLLADEPGLSEHERILFARSLAATPDERWRMHENFLRSHGLSKRSERKKFGFNS